MTGITNAAVGYRFPMALELRKKARVQQSTEGKHIGDVISMRRQSARA